MSFSAPLGKMTRHDEHPFVGNHGRTNLDAWKRPLHPLQDTSPQVHSASCDRRNFWPLQQNCSCISSFPHLHVLANSVDFTKCQLLVDFKGAAGRLLAKVCYAKRQCLMLATLAGRNYQVHGG